MLKYGNLSDKTAEMIINNFYFIGVSHGHAVKSNGLLFILSIRPSVRLVVYLFVHLNWKICFIVISLNHSEHSSI